VKRWPVRLWRWQVTVRPVPILVLYICLYAVTAQLPHGAIDLVRVVMLAVIAALTALVLAIFASAWRQRRKAR
jgi:hypothetical protein